MLDILLRKLIGVCEDTIIRRKNGHHEPKTQQMKGDIKFLGYVPIDDDGSLARKILIYRLTHGLIQKDFARLVATQGLFGSWRRENL